jgi:hypothetical protein
MDGLIGMSSLKMGWLQGIEVAPDGSPLLTRETGTQEVYSLNVRWPR